VTTGTPLVYGATNASLRALLTTVATLRPI